MRACACRLNSLCTICLTQQTNVDKRGRVTGDSFTTALAVHRNNNGRAILFCNVRMTLGICSHLSLLSHFMSLIYPLLFFLLFFEFTISPQWFPQRLMQCAGIHKLMPKLMGRRREWNDLHRAVDCYFYGTQIPSGYIERKLDLEGMRVGCVMSYITIHQSSEVGYHSLQGAMNNWAVCNMTAGCRSHKNSNRVWYVGGSN